MKEILLQNNLDLLRAIEISNKLLNKKDILPEAVPYKNWLLEALGSIKNQIEQNTNWLQNNFTPIFPEILNRTQELSRNYKFIISKLMPSLYRQRNDDQLALKVLNWLHKSHSQSDGKPFAISDGGFAIYPSIHIPVIYFIPISSQHSLLYLPLFFHEFGHFLYVQHKDEMDILVKEFQEKLEDYLEPAFQQNDLQSQREKDKVRNIVETWYEWAQELFCDAVGLQIGGACYLKAFSYHLRMDGRGAFVQEESNLERSSHPVLWLRAMLLAERAKNLNLIDEAEDFERQWEEIAQTLGVTADFYGYYSDHYYSDIMQMLEDMLTEASPITFRDHDQTILKANVKEHNFVQIMNYAWKQYENDILSYPDWESNIIATILK